MNLNLKPYILRREVKKAVRRAQGRCVICGKDTKGFEKCLVHRLQAQRNMKAFFERKRKDAVLRKA